MVSFANLIICIIIMTIANFLFYESNFNSSVLYLLPNLVLRGLICYTSCLQISIVQSKKTLSKIIKSREFSMTID